MSESDQREPEYDATRNGPEIDILHYDDEGMIKLYEPDEMGAYIVVDEFNLMPLCECA